jgi:hypothetical protein
MTASAAPNGNTNGYSVDNLKDVQIKQDAGEKEKVLPRGGGKDEKIPMADDVKIVPGLINDDNAKIRIYVVEIPVKDGADVSDLVMGRIKQFFGEKRTNIAVFEDLTKGQIMLEKVLDAGNVRIQTRSVDGLAKDQIFREKIPAAGNVKVQTKSVEGLMKGQIIQNKISTEDEMKIRAFLIEVAAKYGINIADLANDQAKQAQ